MSITIKRIDDAFQMEAKGSGPHPVIIDAAEKVGGKNQGVRPMELMLMGIGGCSSIDVLSILKKQRQEVKEYSVVVDGEREDVPKPPSVFKKIHIKFSFRGDLDESKVARAIELSMTKYCSVTRIMEKSADITYSYEINK